VALPAEQAQARMAAQAGREERLAVADIVIDNSGRSTTGPPGREVWADLERRSAA